MIGRTVETLLGWNLRIFHESKWDSWWTVISIIIMWAASRYPSRERGSILLLKLAWSLLLCYQGGVKHWNGWWNVSLIGAWLSIEFSYFLQGVSWLGHLWACGLESASCASYVAKIIIIIQSYKKPRIWSLSCNPPFKYTRFFLVTHA